MKYFRVKKDNFLWEEGAILKSDHDGYRPLEDIWNTTEFNGEEYISGRIIENNPEWFERVYSDNLEKLIFKTKDQLKDIYNKFTE